MPRPPTTPDLTTLWYFYLPLALSGIMMSAGQPIVHAGLARLESPELVLAAYGVAAYVAVLLEAPIIMLLPAANALVANEASYRLTRNFMLAMNAFLTVLTALVAFWTPLYNLMFMTLLQFPTEVAQAARPALMVLILWPGLIGIRRFYQGILIRFGNTRIVGLGTVGRLATMIFTLLMGIWFFPEHGVLVGGVALASGVFADTTIAVISARRLLITGALRQETEPTPEAAKDIRAFSRFFLPLAITSTLRIIARPLLLSGIARSYLPMLPLAAFPVALGTTQLAAGHLQMMQQVVVAKVRDGTSFRVVTRFTYLVAGGSSALLALIALSPLSNLYHGTIIGLTGPMLGMANMALLLLVFMPLLTGLQAYHQGLLIRVGRTIPVNIAALMNVLLLVTTVNVVAVNTQWPGHLIAAVVLPLALAIEVLLLRYWTKPVVWELATGTPKRKKTDAEHPI